MWLKILGMRTCKFVFVIVTLELWEIKYTEN